jgi:4-amino-4-deoxy-L-arabinose transferase-like glycosyltransferase
MVRLVSTPAGRRHVVALLIFLASAIDLTVLTRSVPIHVDEAWMLNRGFMVGPLYRDYLRTGALGPAWDSWVWQPRKPPFGNMVIAAGLWLGGAAPSRRPYRYDWKHDHAWNVEHREQVNLPPQAVLQAGRSLVPLFSAAATTAVFLLTASAAGTAGGLVAAALFQLNPVVRHHGSRALSDMVMIALTLWAVCYLVRRIAPAWTGPRGPVLRRIGVFGLLTGLAAATKQNGGIVGCVGMVAFAAWALEQARVAGVGAALRRVVLGALVLAASAYGTYVVVNPTLHRAPIAGAVAQVRAWDQKFREHRDRRPERALTTIAARAGAVAEVLGGARYGAVPGAYVVGLLTLAGTVVLALGAGGPSRWRAPPRIILLWAMVTIAVVTAWVPLAWDRYFLPIIAVHAVLVGSVGRVARLTRDARTILTRP